MTQIAPSIALASCESALRLLVTHTLSIKYGPGWLASAMNEESLNRLEARLEEETRKRTAKGVAVVSTALLDYTQFYELREIIEKNWDVMAPALGKKAVTGALLQRFDDLRNTVAHSRDLIPFEQDLLSGIAGEIRNRIAIYMSTQAPSGEHYPRAEEITDTFGNSADVSAMLQQFNPHVSCSQRLHIGDIVVFRCRGWDPHDRPLEWSLRSTSRSGTTIDEVTGNEIELRWVVEERDVSQGTTVQVWMKCDASYHRWQEGIDALSLFTYTVEPPAAC